MNVVHIPKSHILSENGKEYTVYHMLITVQGRTHEVRKRYRELYDMHRILKKRVNVPPFPPKIMRNRNSKVIEARKAGLQHYFQSIVSDESHCELLLDLLKIPIIHHSSLNESQSIDSFDSDMNETSHRPVIYFKQEVTESSYFSKAQDNIVPGVFIALYS